MTSAGARARTVVLSQKAAVHADWDEAVTSASNEKLTELMVKALAGICSEGLGGCAATDRIGQAGQIGPVTEMLERGRFPFLFSLTFLVVTLVIGNGNFRFDFNRSLILFIIIHVSWVNLRVTENQCNYVWACALWGRAYFLYESCQSVFGILFPGAWCIRCCLVCWVFLFVFIH